ncbi:MAG: two-component regulator propeller domain-containing protein [Leeuwenhoekiella sp.]|uniref:ligand-binding sensor domain-containing protein n=1 Tax=Leeuwenhoekiella sp. TaxID=1977054 RepID=UPI0032430055
MKAFIFLLPMLCIAFTSTSCTQKNTNKPEAAVLTEVVQPLTSDTLKFTSGIRAIFQDSKGSYWLGSHNEGLAVYNGTSFSYFTTANGLAENQIRSFQEDEEGTIWMGTADGVSKFNGTHFTNYTTETGFPEPVAKASSKNLWFNAGNLPGVNWWDGQQLNYVPFPKPISEDLENSYAITGISKDNQGQVWFGTYAGLFVFDGQNLLPVKKIKKALLPEDYIHIRSVFADSKGRIWVGNNGIGVLLIDGDTVINFSEENGLIHPESSRRGAHSPAGTLEHVFSIAEDAH